MRRALLLPALAVAAVAVSCVSSPYAGLDLTIEDCSLGSVYTAFDWVPGAGHGCTNCGALQLRASSLCVAINGTNPSTGQPNLALGKCDAGDQSQSYLYFDSLPTLAIMNIKTAECLEVEGGINCVTAGCRIEQYSCNGGPNQAWTYSNASGTLSIREAPALCLAACRG